MENHASIIMCHYSLCDDFGEQKRNGSPPRSDMMFASIGTIQKYADYPCELIVIDNGGPNDDSDYLVGLTRAGVINTYIRNKNNMYFGWAWNQGAKLATGKYLMFTCNDIQFKEKFLSTTIKPLLDNPQDKYIATPLITPDKDKSKYMRGNLGEYRLNSMAGSNCMIMDRTAYEHIGEFSTHKIAGTHWHQTMSKRGYTVVAPKENMAIHLAHRGGVDFYQSIKVKKTLLTGEEIDYSV